MRNEFFRNLKLLVGEEKNPLICDGCDELSEDGTVVIGGQNLCPKCGAEEDTDLEEATKHLVEELQR